MPSLDLSSSEISIRGGQPSITTPGDWTRTLRK